MQRHLEAINTNSDRTFNDGQSFQSNLLSPNTSSFPTIEEPPPSPSFARAQKATTRHNESRKLLTHVLDQLLNRILPPTVFESFNAPIDNEANRTTLGILVGSVREVVKTKGESNIRTASHVAPEDDDSDDGQEGFSSDATFDLMCQLRDVLLISVAEGWQIFDNSALSDRHDSKSKSSSPFRRSLRPSGRRSRSPSPAAGYVAPMELLGRCLSVLSSVVLEDCRFQIRSPRPSRPPNSLQAMTLEVARFLFHAHRHNAKTVAEIGHALIPAFDTFPSEMHARLVQFFESMISGNLEELSSVNDSRPHASGAESQNFESSPVFITVDDADENRQSTVEASLKWGPWSTQQQSTNRCSTNGPNQPLPIYYLASLISPLLGSMLEQIDLTSKESASPLLWHGVSRVINLIFGLKQDAYLNLMEVVAYHTPRARLAAASLLSTFYPKAVGHVTISKPFPRASYIGLASSLPTKGIPENHPFAHEHVVFRFATTTDCRSCSSPIQGFGLLCSFCHCSVHFDCYDYPNGNQAIEYSSGGDSNKKQLARYSFSHLIPGKRGVGDPWMQDINGHTFRWVHVFSLTVCSVCPDPLWGIHSQGLKCMRCHSFVHSTCIRTHSLPNCGSAFHNSSHLTIQWSDLRQSCLEFYGDILSQSREYINQRTYEELNIIASVLSAQLQLITHGVARGTVIVMQKGRNAAHAKEHRVDSFELHRVLTHCEHLLTEANLPMSFSTEDYIRESGCKQSTHAIMFDWAHLSYIASALKSPLLTPFTTTPSSEFLGVRPTSVHQTETSPYPFDIVTLAHIRDVLGFEFNIHSDFLAQRLFAHIHCLGFFERMDRQPHLDTATLVDRQMQCRFPIPLGLDLSADVETLFAATEALLLDLDLNLNELALLLLVRKLWPNGMASEYSLNRLARCILRWILTEDETLATILRDFVARQRTLPGVRVAGDEKAWPTDKDTRPAPPSAVSNGGDYIATRRALCSRYALVWLRALHDQDSASYALILYDCAMGDLQPELDANSHQVKSLHYDNGLRNLARLSQTLVTFTVFDELFLRWLDEVSQEKLYHVSMPALLRLFVRDDQRYSTVDSLEMDSTYTAPIIASELWDTLLKLAAQSKDALLRCTRWVSSFAAAGIDVPSTIYLRLSVLSTAVAISLDDSMTLLRAVMASAYIRSRRPELQGVVAELHARLSSEVMERLRGIPDTAAGSLEFLRLSLGTCLLLYGCERSKLSELGMITEEDVKTLPSRRKITRNPPVSDPITIDPKIMKVIDRCIAERDRPVSTLIAKFFCAFLFESPLLESHEKDNFILRNGRVLAKCAWSFYDIQHHEVSSMRTSFLLRILVVDTQPFKDILRSALRSTGEWEDRLVITAQLFRIIVDVNSPSFNVDDSQWRSSVLDIFYYFFKTLWEEDREEVRLVADTLSSKLLSSHFAAISECWSEAMAKLPVAERLALISFLIQLRSHFPAWQVLPWNVIIDCLQQDRFDWQAGSVDVSESSPLGVAILTLTLGMIGEGLAIDLHTLLRIKEHLVRILGFENILLRPSANGDTYFVEFGAAKRIPSVALPCVHELLRVLDASHPLNLGVVGLGLQGKDGGSSPLLVGSPYLDIALGLIVTNEDPASLPPLALKNLLECFHIATLKHDFTKTLLRPQKQHLHRAALQILQLLEKEINYESRQHALSAIQAYLKKFHGSLGSFVHVSLEHIAKLIASQSHTTQDALVAQARALMEKTLSEYHNAGILLGLMKRRLDPEFFQVAKQVIHSSPHPVGSNEPLQAALLWDTLSRLPDIDQNVAQNVMNNLLTYIEVIFHQGYSAEMMILVGQQLIGLQRKMLDLPPDAFDIASLLAIPALLLQHNKAQSRELLGYLDVILRASLSRMNVKTQSLTRLVQITATVHRKASGTEAASAPSVALIIFELLSEALRLKARIPPVTLKAMIETIMQDIPGVGKQSESLPTLFMALSEGAIFFLQAHVWADVTSDNDFVACLEVSKMLLDIIRKDFGVMSRVADVWGVEKRVGFSMAMRAWNMLLLAAMLDSTDAPIASALFAKISTFAVTHSSVLRSYTQSRSSLAESAITDINHAYVAIKLWLLLVDKLSFTERNTTPLPLLVWNELWTPFEELVQWFVVEAQHELTTVAILTWSTVADLFMFVRTLKSPVALDNSSHISLLNRLRSLGRGEAHVAKLTRAVTMLAEPPAQVEAQVLVNQVAKDIVAAEKLRLLDVRKDSKPGHERSRTEGRV